MTYGDVKSIVDTKIAISNNDDSNNAQHLHRLAYLAEKSCNKSRTCVELLRVLNHS